MNLYPRFCSFIAIEPNLGVDNSVLEKYCKDKIYSSSNYAKGNNQSDLLNLFDPELNLILVKVNRLINEVGKTIGLKEGLRIVRSWTNLDHNDAITQPHAHTKSVISCVYYVKGDETSGDITFMTPISTIDYVIDRDFVAEQTDFNTSETSIPPLTSSLIIFPSWLQHYVKSSSGAERISIAFEASYA